MDNLAIENDVAVIGCSFRFPGASGPSELWRLLSSRGIGIRQFSTQDLENAGIDRELINDPRYVARKGIIENIEYFDCALFRIPPREAELLAPQHRLLMKSCYEVLDRCGYLGDGTLRAGLYAGVGTSYYALHHLLPNIGRLQGVDQYQVMLNNDEHGAISRIAYALNLKGPSVAINTACSTSLTALHYAVQGIIAGECDIALAGGASVEVPQISGYLSQEQGIQSVTGYCRPFESRADGTIFSNGCGIVLLKALENAIRDKDEILGVIKATVVNNDGSEKSSYTAPSVSGQAQAAAEAINLSGVSVENIRFLEAHGTGTHLGDPIEVAAMAQAFAKFTNKKGFCRLGSVKANFGHLDTAAGIAGLIKVLLCMHNKTIVGQPEFETPNRELNLAETAFSVGEENLPWNPGSEETMFAAVNSVGLGGSNAHVILQSYPNNRKPTTRFARLLPEVVPLLVSSHSPVALESDLSNISAWIEGKGPSAGIIAADYLRKRKPLDFRAGILLNTESGAIRTLFDRRKVANPSESAVAFMFPGQGNLYRNMGKSLLTQVPGFSDDFKDVEELLKEHFKGFSLSGWLQSAELDALASTIYQQPAIFAFQYAMARSLIREGIKPTLLLGHSIGEITAACISEMFTLEEAVRVVVTRSQLMNEAPPGAMLALAGTEEFVRDLADSFHIEVACRNSELQFVLSGALQDVARVVAHCREKDIRHSLLRTSHAFHSRFMEEAAGKFKDFLEGFSIRAGAIPIMSSMDGQKMTMNPGPTYWSEQLRRPVDFHRAAGEAMKLDLKLFLDLGPGCPLAKAISLFADSDAVSQVSVGRANNGKWEDEIASWQGSLVSAWCCGIEARLGEWIPNSGNDHLTALEFPSRSFDEQKCWIEPPSALDPNVALSRDGNESRGLLSVAQHATRQEIEDWLMQSLEKLSGETGFTVSSSYFDLNLESMTMLQLVQDIIKRWGVHVRIADLFRDLQTIEALTGHIYNSLALGRDLPGALNGRVASKSAEPSRKVASRTQRIYGATLGGRPQTSGFSKDQARFIHDVINGYSQMTAKSKEMAATSRTWHADSRNILGFKPWLKEATYPIFTSHADGACIVDVDGNSQIDFTMGFGVNLFGHKAEFIDLAISERLRSGWALGPLPEQLVDLAKDFCAMTGHERVAFTNTGTEAIMGALRLARTCTGREKVVVFDGSYHGTFDGIMAMPGTRLDESFPLAPGIPDEYVQNTIVLEYGSQDSIRWIAENSASIACVLVEPVQSRNPGLQPAEFLRDLSQVTKLKDIVLVFDEVITGFRAGIGGCRQIFGVDVDLCIYGKLLGGGLPIGVLAGKRKVLDMIDGGDWNYGDDSMPGSLKTYFAGTFTKHPLTLAAMSSVLSFLRADGERILAQLNSKVSAFCDRVNDKLTKKGYPVRVEHFSSLFRFDFGDEFPIEGVFYLMLYQKGIYVWEGRNCFLSTAHTDKDLEYLEFAALDALDVLSEQGFFVNKTTEFDLSEGQRGIWAASMLGQEQSQAFHLSTILEVKDEVDPEKIKRTLNRLASRHEALRTVFSLDGSTQKILPDLTPEFKYQPVDVLGQRETASKIDIDAAIRDFVNLPFNLSRGPLHRLGVWELPGEGAVFAFVFHHIISDEFSLGVYAREFLQELKGKPLPKISMPYSVATRKLIERQTSPIVEEDMKWWLNSLQGLEDKHYSPLRQSRKNIYECKVVEFELTETDLLAIREIRTSAKVTDFTVFYAASALILHAVAKKGKVVLGFHASGQEQLNTLDLMGMFVQVLPVASNLDAGQDVSSYLSGLGEKLYAALERSLVPTHELARRLSTQGKSPDVGMVTCVFNLDRAAAQDDLSEDVGMITEKSFTAEMSQWDFSVNVMVRPDRTMVTIKIAADVEENLDIVNGREIFSNAISLLKECIGDEVVSIWRRMGQFIRKKAKEKNSEELNSSFKSFLENSRK